MKNFSLALFVAVIFSSFANGQDAVSAPPRVIRRTSTNQLDSATPSNDQPLDANYALTIQGRIAKDQTVDVTLRGAGPKFTASLVDPDVHIDIFVTKQDQGYSVAYAIGASIPKKAGESGSDYRNSAIAGKVLLDLDEPLAIMNLGKDQLTICISKVVPKKQ